MEKSRHKWIFEDNYPYSNSGTYTCTACGAKHKVGQGYGGWPPELGCTEEKTDG